ncbi:DUF418 domain-containing protein [Paenibacillus sp. TRM 82003]|nr:DUF418 domain-containing protein [Paenibacillus sp. TRM 82003]
MSQGSSEAAPGRIDILDVVRGVALLGICFVNVPDMTGAGLAYRPETSGADSFIRMLYDMFVQTKFYTLFAFLFGVGFYLFMQKAEAKGLRPGRLMFRRLLFLLAIGLVHLFGVWFGDILHSYAVIGFLLLLFYRRKPVTTLVWSCILLGLAAVFMVGVYGISAALAPEALSEPLFAALPDAQERASFFLTSGIANLFVYLPEILGLFLLGMYAGKKNWFAIEGGLSDRTLKRAVWIWGAVSCLLFLPMLLSYLDGGTYNSYLVFPYVYLSGKSMAIVYFAAFLLLVRRFGAERFGRLSAFGRMAFTNYLTQTLIMVGLVTALPSVFGGRSLWWNLAFSAAVLALQLWWSPLWLKRFGMGPLERVWRAFTYGSASGAAGSGSRRTDVGM